MGRFFDKPERMERAWQESLKAAKHYAADHKSSTEESVLAVSTAHTAAVAFTHAMACEIGLRVLELTDALEKRIAELEKTPLAYDGPYETGKAYSKGTFVTHDGSLWHANYKTASRPGDGPSWTLAVKRGRDAR
jgi:hypothetical protein